MGATERWMIVRYWGKRHHKADLQQSYYKMSKTINTGKFQKLFHQVCTHFVGSVRSNHRQTFPGFSSSYLLVLKQHIQEELPLQELLFLPLKKRIFT